MKKKKKKKSLPTKLAFGWCLGTWILGGFPAPNYHTDNRTVPDLLKQPKRSVYAEHLLCFWDSGIW